MKKSFKKSIAVLLAVLMVVCSVPFTTFAATKPNINIQFGVFSALDTNRRAYADNSRSADFAKNSGLNAAKLDYNKATGTISDTDHVYGEGDYFTATVLLENVSQIAAAQVSINYSDNLTPAGSCKYERGDKAYTEADYDGSSEIYLTPADPIAAQSGHLIYNDVKTTDQTAMLGETSYIDAQTRTINAIFAAQTGEDYVDTSSKTVGVNTFTNTAVLATFAFKITGEGAINFSIADANSVDDAYYLGSLANNGNTADYITYAPGDNSGSTGLDFMGGNEFVAVTKYTIVFKNEDGSEISSTEYEEGATVTVPDLPPVSKDDTNHYTYRWDVTPATTAVANATYQVVKTGTAHTWNEGEITREPTATENGEILYTCTFDGCGATKTEPIPATGETHTHTWGEWTVKTPAVYKVSDTVMTRKCATCGESEDVTVANTRLLRVNAINLTLGSNIAVNAKINKSTVDSANFARVYCVVEKIRSSNGDRVPTTIDESEFIDGKTPRMQYVYEEMNPQNMMDKYDITFYAVTTDGMVVPGPTYKYSSIAEYAKSEITKEENASKTNYKRMLVDMLKYGAQAQLYTGYDTDTLATSVLTEEELALGSSVTVPEYVKTQNTKYEVIDNPTRAWKSIGLILDSAVRVRLRLSASSTETPMTDADLQNIAVRVVVEGGATKLYTYEENPELFVPAGDEEKYPNQYYFYFNDLAVSQIRNNVYYTICDKDGNALSNTLLYKPETFVINSSPASLKSLLDAMMVYADSCRDYVANQNG